MLEKDCNWIYGKLMTDPERLPARHEHPLRDFEGTYIGISPADETGEMSFSEIQLTIDSEGVIRKYATGLGVVTLTTPIAQIRELAEEQVDEVYPSGQDLSLRVFSLSDERYLIFNMAPEDEEEAMLFVSGGMEDFYGPTALYSPEQVERGIHHLLFDELDETYGYAGAVARIGNGGMNARLSGCIHELAKPVDAAKPKVISLDRFVEAAISDEGGPIVPKTVED